MARAKDTDRLSILGIRHHGPGSARSVLAALEAADPAVVLIEGPPDADALIPFAASVAMRPPVAILIYGEDDPSNSTFYPFAVYSPEWQAMRWAAARSRPVRFIDLPAAHQLAERAKLAAETKAAAAAEAAEPENEQEEEPGDETASASELEAPGSAAPQAVEPERVRRDPLAYLAKIAGYEDSEAWWNALIEQSANSPDVFPAIEAAMAALREHVEALPPVSEAEALREKRREAHMRLTIAEALKETEGQVAVVCGAWHAPALRRKVSAADDRALLKGLPRLKVAATWVPWTDTRLASASGYGAGVTSPGWYAHLWHEMEKSRGGSSDSGTADAPHMFASRWQARVAALLRKSGRPASTASVIEAVRLANSLAALRDLAIPGLEEMREASLATLCGGETAPWHLIEQQLVIGNGVGEIDPAVPQMPLLADLTLWQKKLKLKPEALDRELSLDLRSDAGLAKSLLLHRLTLIDVPWGRLAEVGSSRGTFRENWVLRWEPELAVKLAEAVVHGATIEQAAGNKAIADARNAPSLDKVSGLVRSCLLAGLDSAATTTIAVLQGTAAGSSDVAALAGAVPPLADILRYGTARAMPVDALRLLVTSLAEAVCAGLVYACRSLQEPEADAMRDRLAAFNAGVDLLDSEALRRDCNRALQHLANDTNAHPLLRGLAVRALYDQAIIAPDAAGGYLSRALSPSVPPLEAGRWLDGFLGESGQILIHDAALRGVIDGWLAGLGEEDFVNLLAMLRRAFSSFDRLERRRLLDEIRSGRLVSPSAASVVASPAPGGVAASDEAPGFAEALPLLLTILCADPTSLPKEESP